MKKNKGRSQRPSVKQPLQPKITETQVQPPPNLTPSLCNRLQHELMDACNKVAAAHGLTVEGGELSDINLRYGFNIGFRVGIPMVDGSLYSFEKTVFEALAEGFGLTPSDYGRTFRCGGELFRLTALNPNRPKYPISAERVADGRGFKFSVENVLLHLQNS